MIDIDELSLDIQYNINKDENKDDNRHGRQTPTPPVGWGGNTSPNSMNYYPIPKPVPFHVSKYFPLDPGKQAEMMERKFREVREQDAKGDRQGGMKRKDGASEAVDITIPPIHLLGLSEAKAANRPPL